MSATNIPWLMHCKTLSLECTMASCLFQTCQLQKCVVCISKIDSIVIKIDLVVSKIDSVKKPTQCKTIDSIVCHVSLDILTIYWFYLVRVDFNYNWVNSYRNGVDSEHIIKSILEIHTTHFWNQQIWNKWLAIVCMYICISCQFYAHVEVN